jgi:hypothetical protein
MTLHVYYLRDGEGIHGGGRQEWRLYNRLRGVVVGTGPALSAMGALQERARCIAPLHTRYLRDGEGKQREDDPAGRPYTPVI